jgi:UrcA family protein
MVRQARRAESRHQADRATGGSGEQTVNTLKSNPQEIAMKFALALATSILSLSALDAQAAAPADAYEVTVQYGDLNLDSKPGIAALYQRIRNAAQHVCLDQAGERLVAKHTYAVCVDLAVSAAVTRIDRPMLTNYVVQKTGKAVAGASARVAGR